MKTYTMDVRIETLPAIPWTVTVPDSYDAEDAAAVAFEQVLDSIGIDISNIKEV